MLDIAAPEWVENQGKPTNGLDLLGLRLPVQIISGSLLNGVTTISPRIRYLSIRLWIIKAFGESGLTNDPATLSDFSGRVEAAIAIAMLLNNPKTLYVPGSERASKIIKETTDIIPVSKLLSQTAFNAYAGPTYDLLLSFISENGVAGLTKERGEPLAMEFESLIYKTRFFKILKENPTFDAISKKTLEELGSAINLDQLPEPERQLLLKAVIPGTPHLVDGMPLRKEIYRIGVYTLLLALADFLQRLPVEVDVFDVALNPQTKMNEVLTPFLDEYLLYRIRDVLAVVHEAVLGEVCTELGGHEESVSSTQIIQVLLSNDHINDVLRQFNLLGSNESFETLHYKEIFARVESQVGKLQFDRGINRWSSKLDETSIIQLIMKNKYAAIGLQPVVWILCKLRVGSYDLERYAKLEILSRRGYVRFGLEQVILSQLQIWSETNPTLDQIIAWQIQMTIDQHLRIAWSRMFADVGKDVAILTSDGDQLKNRGHNYVGGRTASRVSQAIGWLEQLGLIDDNGLTFIGEGILQQGYKILKVFGGEA